MFKWLVVRFPFGLDPKVLQVGDRVKTPQGGKGTVTGGSLHVDLDEGQSLRPAGSPRVNITMNLNNVRMVKP